MSHFPPNIVSATSTIADGNMSFLCDEQPSVIKNRGQFLAQHCVPFAQHVCMACNNGQTILAVTSNTPGVGAEGHSKMPNAEVLVTRETNLALMLLTADCIPASFYDPVQKVIALAHLNRHTVAFNLAQKTVAYLQQHYQSQSTDLLVYFGPHIQVDSYQFPLPLDTPPAAQLADFVMKQNDQVKIDLQGAFKHQLIKAGVPKTNITVSASDTGQSDRYFSHYRSTRNSDHPAGRMATILMMHDPA